MRKLLDTIWKPLAAACQNSRSRRGQDNMDTATTTTAPALRIIKFGFRDYTYTAKKRTAVCNICSAKINLIIEEAHKTMPSPASTSNLQVQVGEPEAGHQSGLFTGYRKKQKMNSCSSPLIQLNHYLDICDGQNAL
ncbi:hypothetical protein HF521_012460 [Silurus meridionalis]|uniref:Uncharacterized protein n=1 Tax=Silurus meridionalis TaxID=175797 RepID=A0A8T0AJ01_SILME|nr:hypothetical protein HF521_012460 [Silurus meridionalis]